MFSFLFKKEKILNKIIINYITSSHKNIKSVFKIFINLMFLWRIKKKKKNRRECDSEYSRPNHLWKPPLSVGFATATMRSSFLHHLLPLLIKQTPPNSFHIDPLSSSITTPPRDRLTDTPLSLKKFIGSGQINPWTLWSREP